MTFEELKSKTCEMEFCDYIQDQEKAIFHFKGSNKVAHIKMPYKFFKEIEEKYASENLSIERRKSNGSGRPKKHIFDVRIVIDMYEGGSTYDEISEEINISKTYLTNIIQTLVAGGFVERRNKKHKGVLV